MLLCYLTRIFTLNLTKNRSKTVYFQKTEIFRKPGRNLLETSGNQQLLKKRITYNDMIKRNGGIKTCLHNMTHDIKFSY